VVDAFEDLQAGHLGACGVTAGEARTLIARGRGTRFDAETVDIFLQLCVGAAQADRPPPRSLAPAQLSAGMVLARDLVSAEGVVLLTAGQRLTEDLIQRIRRHEARGDQSVVLWIDAAPA